MQQEVHYLVAGYCKKNVNFTLPHCLIKLLTAFLLKYMKIQLFNFRYLGNNIHYDEIDWDNFVHSIFTSIFSGVELYFDLFHKFTISFGSKLSVNISLNETQFSSNFTKKTETIKSVLGNIWKYEQGSHIKLLILMDRGDTCCDCNTFGQGVKIYLLNDNNDNATTETIYKYIWDNHQGIDKLHNDATGLIEIRDTENAYIDYDANENVEIEYNGELKVLSGQNDFIINPINDYAQGWACCYRMG